MSHQTALQNDVRSKLSSGQVLAKVIVDEDVDEAGKAVVKHRKVTVFVRPNGLDLSIGDTVCVKIADVREDSALAIASGIVG
jgi:predicted RNA-binding protein with TRAM domain